MCSKSNLSLRVRAINTIEFINKYDELKIMAGKYCLAIFNDLTEDEVKVYPRSVQKAWEIGKQINEK